MNDTNDEGEEAAADASPAKRFFIYMLIKDIELIPSVVDLVDNSVDAARIHLEATLAPSQGGEGAGEAAGIPAAGNATPQDRDLTGYWVKISAGPDRFEISDNCGGIPLDTAERYAFRFGRPEDFPGSPLAVGQFGVGMKRALFKLGTQFTVSSVAEGSRFILPVNVEEWARDLDPRWRFVFSEADADYSPADGVTKGTSIQVDRLHPSVAEDFASMGVQGDLRIDLELRHQSALEAGMAMTLNDEPLRPSRPELALSDEISPIHIIQTLNGDGGSVRMELFAGISRAIDADPGDDIEPEEYQTVPEAGWYLFCNNRLLLAGDTSDLTGWGDGANAYHPQYRSFRGFVYLDGDSRLLPWNTTKTSVDRDSRIFRLTKAQMAMALRSVQNLLNKAKNEGQRVPAEDRVIAPAIASARSAPLVEIPLSDVMKYPEPTARRAEDTIKRIAYAVAKDDFDAVAEALETESAREVGRKTFQFFLETQID
jgi:hypothetical protein